MVNVVYDMCDVCCVAFVSLGVWRVACGTFNVWGGSKYSVVRSGVWKCNVWYTAGLSDGIGFQWRHQCARLGII